MRTYYIARIGRKSKEREHVQEVGQTLLPQNSRLWNSKLPWSSMRALLHTQRRSCLVQGSPSHGSLSAQVFKDGLIVALGVMKVV